MVNPSAKLVPQLISGIDIRRLPIGPEEAFVMSRIDGVSTSRDIEYATGLPEERVAQCLGTLESLGAIRYPGAPSDGVPKARVLSHSGVAAVAAPQVNLTEAPRSGVTCDTTGKLSELTPPSASLPKVTTASDSPAPSSSPCDLDPERQHEIRALFQGLDDWDYYRLLGVDRGAERRAIKDAYYSRVRIYHPDRYYGKNLGEFRQILEKCFAALTSAYDTLSSGATRAEYDEYLKEKAQAYELEQSLKASISPADLDALAKRLAEAIPPSTVSNPSPALLEPPQPEPGPLSASDSQRSPASRQLTDDERRRVLAKKLRLSQPNLRISSPPPPPPSHPSVVPKEQIAEQLKRTYEQSRRSSNLAQVQQLVAEADDALSRGDAVKAANALRTAQTLAPNDPEVAGRLTQAQTLASAALAETYKRQGEYEEKSGRFDAAARSYERAANGKPEASTWEAAARCLLEAKGDLRTATDLVRRAMALAPGRAASHLLLGRIFISARMRSSAQAELERARSLDPNNDTVSALLKQLERDSH